MNSQWGRNGRAVQSGAGGKFARFLALFIALDIGIVGGYGLSRWLDDTSSTYTLEIASQRAEIDRLQQTLSEASEQGSVLSELQDENAKLKSEIDQLYSDIADLQGDQSADDNALRDTISSLRVQLSEAQSALAGRELEIQRLSASEKGLADKLAAATDEIEFLQGKLLEVEADLEATLAEVSEVESRLEAETTAGGELKKRIADLTIELQTARETTIPDLEAEVARLRQSSSGQSDPTVDENSDPGLEGNALKARELRDVEFSLETAPGIANYENAKREKLVSLLVSGACVTTSLKEALGDVSVVLLAHLIKEFGGDC